MRIEALNDIVGDVYFQAVNEHELDVIAQPDIEILEGQDSGPVTLKLLLRSANSRHTRVHRFGN